MAVAAHHRSSVDLSRHLRRLRFSSLPPKPKRISSKRSLRRPARRLTPTRVAGLPFRGVAMQLQRVDFIDGRIPEIPSTRSSDVALTTVLFVVDSRMETAAPAASTSTCASPHPQQLGGLDRLCKSKISASSSCPSSCSTTPRGMEWRAPSSRDERDCGKVIAASSITYSWIAEKHQGRCPGRRPNGQHRKQTGGWRQTIDEVRKTSKV